MIRLRAAAPFLLACAALAAVCGPSHSQASALEPALCRVPAPPGAACGWIDVPEDWGRPGGRRLRVHVLRLPVEGDRVAREPVFFLAAGPGEAASAYAAELPPPLKAATRGRELVLVDVRGTGRSSPLGCPGSTAVETSVLSLPGIVACRDALAGAADLRFYDTLSALADLDAVRAALGV